MGRKIEENEYADLKRLGDLLKTCRRKKNFTLEYVSKAINIKVDTISKYENGRKDISFLTLKKFCKFYKIRLSSLFYKTDYPSSNEVVVLTDKLRKLNSDYIETAKKLHYELDSLK